MSAYSLLYQKHVAVFKIFMSGQDEGCFFSMFIKVKLSSNYIHNLKVLILLFMFEVVIFFILRLVFHILIDSGSFKVFMVFEVLLNGFA